LTFSQFLIFILIELFGKPLVHIKSGSYIDYVWTHTDANDIWNLNLLTVTKQIFSDITVHIN